MPSPIQISEAFKRFGISDGDDAVMVVLVHNKDESQPLSDIAAKVDGLQVPVEDMSSLSDTAKIKKVSTADCYCIMRVNINCKLNRASDIQVAKVIEGVVSLIIK